ncbi:MAG: tetratricopeptide repeat protein [Magnetovibrionaceae bacterium]
MIDSSPARFRVLALTALLLAPLGACSSTPSENGPDQSAEAPEAGQLLRIADATAAGGDFLTAAGLYRRAHEQDPDDPAPLARLGDLQTRLGETEAAINSYKAAITRDPDNTALATKTAKALIKQGDAAEARDLLEAARGGENEDPALLNLYGVTLDLLGQHKDAWPVYEAGLKITPDDSALNNNYSLSLALGGAYREAVVRLLALSDLAGATVRHRQNLALVYGLQGDEEKAERLIRLDLPEAAVERNLRLYRELRSMPEGERSQAVLRAAGAIPISPPMKPTVPDAPES